MDKGYSTYVRYLDTVVVDPRLLQLYTMILTKFALMK